jgi:hypothetical protein
MREFPLRTWYSSSSAWYYHQPGRDRHINATRRFYRQIDRDLRELCHLLHEAGIITTPSCSGHWHERSHFENIWDSLKRQEHLIKTTGLDVTESESGRTHRFRSTEYHLPWSRLAEFYDQTVRQQSSGYIGVLIPRHRVDLCCRLHRQPYRTKRARIAFDGQLSCILDGSLFAIGVEAPDAGTNTSEWKAITEHVRDLLRHADREPANWKSHLWR